MPRFPRGAGLARVLTPPLLPVLTHSTTQTALQRLDGLRVHTLELLHGSWNLRGATVCHLIVNNASVAASQASLVDCSNGDNQPWVWRKLAAGAVAGCVAWAAIQATFPAKLGTICSLRVHIPVQSFMGDPTGHIIADLRLLCQRLGPDKAGRTCRGRSRVLQVLLGCDHASFDTLGELAPLLAAGQSPQPTPTEQAYLREAADSVVLVSRDADATLALNKLFDLEAERMQRSQFPGLQAAQQPGLRVVHVCDEAGRELPL